MGNCCLSTTCFWQSKWQEQFLSFNHLECIPSFVVKNLRWNFMGWYGRAWGKKTKHKEIIQLQKNIVQMWICFFFREFKIEDGKAVIPLGITVQGDVLIVIYHARSTLGGRLQAKVIINLTTCMNGLLLGVVSVVIVFGISLSTWVYLVFCVQINVFVHALGNPVPSGLVSVHFLHALHGDALVSISGNYSYSDSN